MVVLARLAVEAFVDGLEVGVGDVGVDLSRSNIAVTEHGLHASEVRTIHKKVCRE